MNAHSVPSPRIVLAALALVLASLCATDIAHASPDMPGPLTVVAWDAGSVSLAGANIHVVVYHPDGGGPYPLVGVVHGASRNGTFQRVLAQTLASYGLVAVVPDMPCTVFSCDHDANANQLIAMLNWAVAQSTDGTSPIAGSIDGSRRGLVGHSWGALGSHIAASRSPSLASLVLLDPNDDRGIGAAAASMVITPTLQLLAENRATCNNQWITSNVTPMLGGPSLATTIARAGHCDPEDPTDTLCPLACGNGDASTTPIYRRYAVAWTLCNLVGDAAMAAWVGGSSLDGDVASGALAGVTQSRLDALRCRGSMAVDAGTTFTDANSGDAEPNDTGLEDAVSVMDATDDVAPISDSGAHDATNERASVADSGSATSGAGCRCEIARTRSVRGYSLAALSMAVVAAGSRRRRSPDQRAVRTQ